MEKVKVALIGFGGIARFHNAAYKKLMAKGADLELVAVCDKNVEQFTKTLTINIGGGDSVLPEGIHTYADIDDLIANEEFDMADVCLPTFLHKTFVIKLLEAGKHVLCEKPMALCYDDAKEMLDVANEKGLRLIIGLGLHFEPAYQYLFDAHVSEKYGKLQHASFWRNSTYPNWGAGDHFSNVKKSGGLTMDMHIHDVDIVRHFFGIPESMDCVMYDNLPHVQLVRSHFYYPEYPVLIEASWDETHDFTFKSGYDAKFEKASIVLRDGELTVYPYWEEPFKPELPEIDEYEEEIAYMADLVAHPRKKNKFNPPECTLVSTRLIEQIRENAAKKNYGNKA